MVLAIGHALRAHEALSCLDSLSGFLEVDNRLFEDGVFVGHDQSIRASLVRSPDCFAFSCKLPAQRLEVSGRVSGYVLRVLRSHLRADQPTRPGPNLKRSRH
jgi:hypothetical protein